MPDKKKIIVSLSYFNLINQQTIKDTLLSLRKEYTDSYLDSYVVRNTIAYYLIYPFASWFNLNAQVHAALLDNSRKKILERSIKLIDKQLSSQDVINYNMGKIDTKGFIKKLANNLYLTQVSDCEKVIKHAWNSGVDFEKFKKKDDLFTNLENLITLSEQGKSIYLIADINPLHAEAVINSLDEIFPNKWNLPEQATKDEPIQVSQNIYLCPSYHYGTLIGSKSNLIAKVVKSLPDSSNLLFVGGQKRENIIAKQLNIEISSVTAICKDIKANVFYTEAKNSLSTEVFPSSGKLFPLPSMSSTNTSVEYVYARSFNPK